MNTKIKLALAAFGLFILSSAKAEAMTYVTVNSTCVCLATNSATMKDEWPYAIMEVRTSTPANNDLPSYLAVVDSAALTFSQTYFQRPDRPDVTIATQNISVNAFTGGQFIIPNSPLVAVATATTSGMIAQGNPQPNVIKFGGENGYVPRNGFCAMTPNPGAGLPFISIGVEAIPAGGLRRR